MVVNLEFIKYKLILLLNQLLEQFQSFRCKEILPDADCTVVDE